MKKLKTLLLFVIVFFSVFLVFQKPVNAEYSGTGGTGGGSAGTTGSKGSWNANFGFYIRVYNQNNNQKGSTVDVSVGSYASPSIAALKGWVTKDSSEVWHSNPEILYKYLNIPYGNVSGNYETLLNYINVAPEIGDYIVIEPYTTIAGVKHTYRDINDSTKTENICEEKKCLEYKCAEYAQKCISRSTTCVRYSDVCLKYSDLCLKRSNTVCDKYSTTCTSYKTTCASYKCATYKCTFSLFGLCIIRSKTECQSYSSTCESYKQTCATSKTTCATYACETYKCAQYKCAEYGCNEWQPTSSCATYSNECINRSKTECGKTKTVRYVDWYAKPSVILSNAAKVGSTITVGGKTFTAPGGVCTVNNFWSNQCGYKNDRNIGYGLTVVRYEDIYRKGTAKISIKKNDTKQLIITKNATFSILDSSGAKVVDLTTKSGVAEYDLDVGDYTIKQITPPQNYFLVGSDTVSIKIEASKVTEKEFLYNAGCEARLDELGANPTPQALITLYKNEKANTGVDNTNLLNFSNPSCGKADCGDKKINEPLSCLSGKRELSTTFNENNLSCYDDLITSTDGYGNYIGFCLNYFELTNNLGVNKFYGTAGQFLIRQNNNKLEMYNSSYNLTTKNSIYVANSKSGRVCYILSGNTYNPATNTKANNIYFGDVDGDSNADLLTGVADTSKTKNESVAAGYFTKYTYELTYNYKFSKPIYLEKITGKYSSSKTNSTTTEAMYGILSKFNSSSGHIPFSIVYDGKTYSSDACKYETQKEIITYDKNPNGDIEVEFRSIDTNNPFVGRETNTNFCHNSDCKINNKQVQTYIKDRNNSYNQTGDGPLYKITLTPADIQIIKNYNNNNVYNNYSMIEVNYSGVKKIRNKFLYSIESKSLDGASLSGKLYNKKYE